MTWEYEYRKLATTCPFSANSPLHFFRLWAHTYLIIPVVSYRWLSRLKALVESGFHGKLTHYTQHVLLKQYTPLGCYLWSPHVYTILWILTFSLHYFSSSSLPLPTSPPTPSNSWGLLSSFSFTTWLKAWTPWSRIALGRRWQSQMDCNLAGPLPTRLIPGMERMKATTKLARYVQVLQ